MNPSIRKKFPTSSSHFFNLIRDKNKIINLRFRDAHKSQSFDQEKVFRNVFEKKIGDENKIINLDLIQFLDQERSFQRLRVIFNPNQS